MSKKINIWLAALLVGLLSGSAWADRPDRHWDRRHHGHHGHYGHHGHHDQRSGVRFAVTIGNAWHAPSPFVGFQYAPRWPHVYAPPVVPVFVSPPPPVVYVEQRMARPAVPALEPGYWYYCNESQTYYPYVQQCSGNWVKVRPNTQ